MSATTLGIDVGTTSVSAVVLDAMNGENLFRVSTPHGAALPPDGPGAFLQDPRKIASCAERALASALEAHPNIAALGVTGQMHGVLLLDKEGRAVSPLLTWMDNRLNWQHTRSKKSYRELMREELSVDLAQGYGAGSIYVLDKEGAIPPEAATFSTLPDYVVSQITGTAPAHISASMAHSVGCFDVEKNDFLVVFRSAQPRLRVPELRRFGYRSGFLENGIPVFLPEGDNQTSFAASVRDPERAVLVNIGTSGQISLLARRGARSVDLEARPFPDGHALFTGASLSGGKSFEIVTGLVSEILSAADCMKLDPYTLLDRTEEAPSQNPLSVSTQFNGTRSRPDARGRISGISLENFTLAQLYRGIARGVISELVDMAGAHLKMLEVDESYATIAGNALEKNAVLREALAERLGRPLRRPRESEAAARGAAMFAASCVLEVPFSDIRQRLIRYEDE